MNWLKKQFSWQMFLLTFHDVQCNKIKEAANVVESLSGYTDALIAGFEQRQDILKNAADENERSKVPRLSVHEKDHFTMALYNILRGDGDSENHGFLSWSEVSGCLSDESACNKDDNGESNFMQRHCSVERFMSNWKKNVSKVDELSHDLHRIRNELYKHSKTNTQVFLTPARLFDLQRQFRDCVNQVQPLLQDSTQASFFEIIELNQCVVTFRCYRKSRFQSYWNSKSKFFMNFTLDLDKNKNQKAEACQVSLRESNKRL